MSRSACTIEAGNFFGCYTRRFRAAMDLTELYLHPEKSRLRHHPLKALCPPSARAWNSRMRPMSEASSCAPVAGPSAETLPKGCDRPFQPVPLENSTTFEALQRKATHNPETGVRKCGPREKSWKTGRLLRPSLIATGGLEGCEQEARGMVAYTLWAPRLFP